jgi:hypothetical protein
MVPFCNYKIAKAFSYYKTNKLYELASLNLTKLVYKIVYVLVATYIEGKLKK